MQFSYAYEKNTHILHKQKYFSKEKATEHLTNYYATLDKESCELAYKLTKQAEDAEKKNERLWNSLRQLK